MTDLKRLNAIIEASGLKKIFIAEKLGIDRASLYNKLTGMTEFTAYEIVKLTEILRLTKSERDDIFLTLR